MYRPRVNFKSLWRTIICTTWGGTPRIIQANDKYLTENLAPRSVNRNFIEFNKVILDHGHSATIELLVLNSKQNDLQFDIIGKIGGQSVINVRDFSKNESPDMIQTLFIGGFVVNLIRLFIASIITCFVVVGIAYIDHKIGSVRNDKRIAKKIRLAEAYLSPLLSKYDEPTQYAVYKFLSATNADALALARYLEILQDPEHFERLDKNLAKITEMNTVHEETVYQLSEKYLSGVRRGSDEVRDLMHTVQMINTSYFANREKQYAVNTGIVNALQELSAVLIAHPPSDEIIAGFVFGVNETSYYKAMRMRGPTRNREKVI